jgi:hypothetical protein
MGSSCDESFEQFLDSIKQAGILISNEPEVRARLAEARRWRHAFMTLVANGKGIGIRFQDMTGGENEAEIADTLTRFQFSAPFQAAFVASLKSEP